MCIYHSVSTYKNTLKKKDIGNILLHISFKLERSLSLRAFLPLHGTTSSVHELKISCRWGLKEKALSLREEVTATGC